MWPLPHAVSHLGCREFSICYLSPLRAREDADVLEIQLIDLYLKPLRALRKLLPERKVADEEKRPPFVILLFVVKVWFADDVTKAVVVLAKLVSVEVAFQEFG